MVHPGKDRVAAVAPLHVLRRHGEDSRLLRQKLFHLRERHISLITNPLFFIQPWLFSQSHLKPCGEVGGLEDGAHGGGLVGVEAVPELPLLAPLRRLEELEQLLLHPRHPGPAADKDHLASIKSAAFPDQILCMYVLDSDSLIG